MYLTVPLLSVRQCDPMTPPSSMRPAAYPLCLSPKVDAMSLAFDARRKQFLSRWSPLGATGAGKVSQFECTYLVHAFYIMKR